MAQELLLISGGTGHVGYAILLAALKKGYRVRAAVRSDAKAEVIKSAEPTKPYLSQLEFTVVKDITESGAFDEAVKGVDAIVHVASPIPSLKIKDFEEELLKPAVHGTTSILYSALKQQSIRRVVITSSVAALFPDDMTKTFYPDDIHEERHGPFSDLFQGYRASKTNANIAVRRFIEQEKPHFTINNVMPGYVIGRNLLAKTKEDVDNGSNAAILGSVLGKTNDNGVPLSIVHLDDVVYIHLSALDPKLEGNNNFGADYSKPFSWDDPLQYAKEDFPEAVKAGIFPLGGHTGDVPCNFDASATEKAFNFKFKTPREMFKDFAGQYIEVAQQS